MSNRNPRNILFFLFILLISLRAQAQSLSVAVHNTNFSVNSEAQMLSGLTNPSAFALNVNSRNSTFSLFAAVTAKSFNPSSATFSQVPFTLTFRSISGGGSASDYVAGNIQLTESPSFATLAQNAAKTTNNKTYVINYDINLLPIAYTIPPGNYVFTVTVQYNDGVDNILQTFNITLTVQTILSVSLVQNQSATLNFNSSAAYANGIAVNNFHTSQIRSNIPWLMSVASASAFFTPGSAGASTNMPCNIVGVRVNGGSNYIQLATTPATLRTGSAGNVTSGNNTTNYDVRFTPGWNYNPGIYNLSITYTVTNQ